MTTVDTVRRSGVLVLAAALTAGTLAACAPAPNKETSRSISGAGKASCPVAPDTGYTGTLRLGYQSIPNPDLVVRAAGVLESCLPSATVQWSQFSSGADVLQAFGSSSLDVATLGSSPVTKALSAPLNLPVKVVWAQDVIGSAESLAVRDRSLTDIAQLKGRTIGVPFSSTSHYSLLAALDRAKITQDVHLVNLQPDAIRGAWQRGEIDAAWVWQPALGELLRDGKLLVSGEQTAAAGAPTFDLSVARSAFVSEQPGVLRAWTAAQKWAVDEIANRPDQATQLIASGLGVTPGQVSEQLPGYRYPDLAEQVGPGLLGGRLGVDLQATARFLHAQGEIDSVAPSAHYAESVYPDAARAVKGA